MTDRRKKPAAKAADKPPKKLTTDELVARIKKLPEGTKEAAAFAEVGHGYSREDFREYWLRDRLGVTVQPQGKAAEKPADAAGE